MHDQERQFLSLRDAPNADAREVDTPLIGHEAEHDVWAEYQVGTEERTFVLVVSKGMIVEEWAIEALNKEQ